MLRLIGRRMSHVLVAAGSDRVLMGITLPSGTRVHDIRVKIQGTATTPALLDKCTMYALEMYILPLLDPDAALDHDVLWDALVPKDTDVQVLDLDTEGSDTSPFYEPGEAEWSQLFDIGLRPERLWHSHELITFATPGVFKFQDNQSAFLPNFVPGMSKTIRIRKRLAISKPSVLVLAMASPLTDDTSGTATKALGENAIGRVKYLGELMHMALVDVLGLSEAGAESPWEEATDLLQEHLDPDVFENTAGAFFSSGYNVYTEATIDHSVVGDFEKMTITTGR